jgi:hypothetical protein
MKEGIEFETGTYGGFQIAKLGITPTVIYLDTKAHTDVSKAILMDLLEWAKARFGITFTPNLIRRTVYINDIIFQTDFPLLECQSKALMSVAAKTSETVESTLREKLIYRASGINIEHDSEIRDSRLASFIITKRGATLHDEHIFYSEAPLPTEVHAELLEEIEAEFRKNYESRQKQIRGGRHKSLEDSTDKA